MASPDVPAPLTCKFCLNEHFKECLMCKSRYCVLHAAKFSPNFCKDCLVNLSVILNTITRSSTEFDMLDDELVIKSVESKTLQLDGADWLFYSKWIEELPEDQWLEIYQFHYFVLKMMEHENEIRKVKRAKRIASAPLSVKITKEAKTQKIVQSVDIQANFEKIGLSESAIRAMLLAAGIPYKERNKNGNP